MLKKRDLVLCICLLLVTALLCLAVNVGLDAKEEARIYQAFTTAPERQPGTVWCTETGDILLIYRENPPAPIKPKQIWTLQGRMDEWELVLISAGYFSLQPIDQPEQALLIGKFYMDDEATFRLEPSNPEAPILQGRPRLIFKRYFIADDDCPFFHVRIN